ncbi:GH25 family lysozyme [Actinacidiphila bryophytorum]|uniref:Lyzozyme M1 (1,4-beta-N-acetylmuramidase), GH25 family n=1 Tax=Actinacidiphila bryophytorum TaxID=1436133 RepID=A0A9W4MII6_9ACTN|nr:GH25 family lysozyme [Actinacidiphila bryophytorum]MBM9437166.1 peptidoglycan-binding protein [Actinacidiphila bryophytorum]MBN6542452.1 peptidoglycan-binding protein [Actinacidiphila bryophytorum]CAG7646941.1 Lyzozyme M1 (1,4-beta-N-acetylmuramidase), GH25 family [Actinacidiphila bryophytorum]
MTVHGIDVASYQSGDYSTSGLDFVFVKATEGSSYANPKHAAQVATARAHGLVVGHYHFARPGSMSAQADYFLAHAGAKAGDVLAFDWEDTGVPGADKDAWLRHVQAKAPEHRVVLYCNRDFWLHRDSTSFCADGLWIADPSAPEGHPRVEHPWLFHQYSSAGGLDRNVGNFAGPGTLRTWAGRGAAPHYEPFPGAGWFTVGRRSPIVAAMHERLVAVGCNHYTSTANKDVIGSGDVASYEAWQRKYNTDHHKGWTGSALKWPPGRETWDALHVPNV